MPNEIETRHLKDANEKSLLRFTVSQISDFASGVAASVAGALNLKAPKASPTFTGVPTVPTATPGTISTQIANTEFVNAEILARLPSLTTAARKIAALKFDGTKQHQVNLGMLARPDVTYSNKFFHEFLIAVDAPCDGYFFSGGWGAVHPFGLHGCAGVGGDQFRLTGNIWDGVPTANPDHTAGDYLYYGKQQIYHVAFAYDGALLYIFVDGILCGTKPYTLERKGNSNPHGYSAIGGTEHSNFNGWAFWARFWEEIFPFAGNVLPTSFRPELLPRNDLGIGNCVFLMSFDQPGYVFPDMSDGFDSSNSGGLRKKHNGILSREGQVSGADASRTQGIGSIFSGDNGGYSGSLKFLTENGLPQYDDSLILAPRPYLGAAPSVPSGYLVYDSFSRADQTWAFQALPNLGQTEGGSLPPLTWGNSAGFEHTWGILSGSAVCYNPNQNCQTVTHAGLGVNKQVFVDRLVENGNPRAGHKGGETGLCYGYVNEGTRGILTCFYSELYSQVILNLVETNGGAFNFVFIEEIGGLPASFTSISVKVEGTRRRVYCDDTLVKDINTGITSIGQANAVGLFGQATVGCKRFKNFRVEAL